MIKEPETHADDDIFMLAYWKDVVDTHEDLGRWCFAWSFLQKTSKHSRKSRWKTGSNLFLFWKGPENHAKDKKSQLPCVTLQNTLTDTPQMDIDTDK